jgi:hypothetical protein
MYVNAKMIAVEIILGMGGARVKESCRGGEFKYDNILYIIRTFVNATMYPHPEQQ